MTNEEVASQLNQMREALLDLHKALVDIQRVWYEKIYGRVDTGEMLQLVAYHPAFAWLHPFSSLIVEIDSKLHDKEDPLTGAAAASLIDDTRALALGQSGDSEFQANYAEALREPAVLFARSRVASLLAAMSSRNR